MPRPTSAAAKTERLLNLVIALLYTRQPMSKSRIRSVVPQYADAGNEAFDRMFERDKGELRDLGIPLRTEVIDPFFDDESGYRIDRREYALPQVEFAPDELAVIGLASRSWSQASLAGPAARAMRKLEVAGLTRDDAGVAGIEPLLHTTEAAFEPVRTAVLARQPISFGYRSADLPQRRVHPWRLTARRGRWYLTGHDLDRDAARVFRLDRISGPVRGFGPAGGYPIPPDHDPAAMITASTAGQEVSQVVVDLREGSGQALRRRSEGIDGEPAQPQPADGAPGWERLVLTTSAPEQLLEEVAALGPAARIVAPPEWAGRWRAHLEAVIAVHRPGTAPTQQEVSG